ncbi:uncharacterized protein CEXT_451241 [Caerostris extrusa]|uniref:Uncharacterized protein n=1 Tax=Caerostris extrusa TaxID=172846 RepID=A0AAV4QM98_CAEEX|nr:uncharacterized protein CEXT_451241 [Caerostris extrusa]
MQVFHIYRLPLILICLQHCRTFKAVKITFKKMPPISLYETCLDRIIELIKVEHWREEKDNPFSRLPSKIVELLVEVCGTSQKIRKFSYFRMLLSSGKLRQLKICFPVIFIDTCMVLPQMLTEKGCMNITVLELDRNFKNYRSEWLEKLLQKLPLLESLSVQTLFNPLALKDCKRLKSVKVIRIFNYDNFLSEAVDTLSHMEDLEEFDILLYTTESSIFLNVVKMLKNHKKLTSLRFTDSSRAAHHIMTNNTGDELPKYGLRKCSWTYDTSSFEKRNKIYISFLERVSSSVLLFPLVEELEILVLSEDCFEYLKELKHLRSLKLNFNRHSTYQSDFSFLSGIGQQLRHLCIISFKEIPVNAISRYCFNLEYLECSATICDSIKSSYSFRMLKRLEISLTNANSLLYVFQNVRNLKELQFHNAAVFDDLRLQEILNRDSLAFNHLDKVFVRDCMLSREGIRIFLEHAVNLTTVYIKSSHFNEGAGIDFSDVIKELQRDVVHDYFAVEHYFNNTSYFLD